MMNIHVRRLMDFDFNFEVSSSEGVWFLTVRPEISAQEGEKNQFDYERALSLILLVT